jgi:hypothetical protein
MIQMTMIVRTQKENTMTQSLTKNNVYHKPKYPFSSLPSPFHHLQKSPLATKAMAHENNMTKCNKLQI